MKEVKSIKEAESYFMSNSSGSVICVKYIDGIRTECIADCYPDAVDFFKRP